MSGWTERLAEAVGSRIHFENGEGEYFTAVVADVQVHTPSALVHVGGSAEPEVLAGPTTVSVRLADVRPAA